MGHVQYVPLTTSNATLRMYILLYACYCLCVYTVFVYSCTVELHVSVCGFGGVWKFPVHLCASMADPDDVIVIEATSLNRETQIQFQLSSMQE